MIDKDKMREEFHEWNEEQSGNQNQEICKYRMQGWQAAKESSRKELEELRTRLSGKTCFVPPEFQQELEAAKQKAVDIEQAAQDEINRLDAQKQRLEAEKEALEKKLAESEFKLAATQIHLRAADEMANVCDEWVVNHTIDSRSKLADARLDYGDPYNYTASIEELTKLLAVAEQRVFDGGMDTILTGSWKIQLAEEREAGRKEGFADGASFAGRNYAEQFDAARQQGFEEGAASASFACEVSFNQGKQIGRDELQKELSEQEPFYYLYQFVEGGPWRDNYTWNGTAAINTMCLIPRPLPPQVKGE
jgi:hypothetical protein